MGSSNIFNYSVFEVYDIRKNKENKFIELKNYLSDIISNIEKELESNLRTNYNKHVLQFGGKTNDWRYRKNHNFMDKYSNKDKVFLNINCEINKITDGNYKVIAEKVGHLIKENLEIDDDESNKIHTSSYLEFIISNIVNKCIQHNLFCNYYLDFLKELDNTISFNEYIEYFNKLLLISPNLKIKEINSELINIQKYDKNALTNFGTFFGSLYNNGYYIKNEKKLFIGIKHFFKNLFDIIEKNPLNEVEFNDRINIFLGLLSTLQSKLWGFLDIDEKRDLESKLNLLANHKNMPIRTKFIIQDLLDKIIIINKSEKINTNHKNKKSLNRSFDVRNMDKWNKNTNNHTINNTENDDTGWERVIRKKNVNQKNNKMVNKNNNLLKTDN